MTTYRVSELLTLFGSLREFPRAAWQHVELDKWIEEISRPARLVEEIKGVGDRWGDIVYKCYYDSATPVIFGLRLNKEES